MTNEECKTSTIAHMSVVCETIRTVTDALLQRALHHDGSKLLEPELSGFGERLHLLKGLTYGSEEYKAQCLLNKPTLDHHYANNRHHPEFFRENDDDPLTVSKMNLVDIVEMLCDWKAATLRHADGDIVKSINHNAKRFNMSPELTQIFLNTVEMFDHIKE